MAVSPTTEVNASGIMKSPPLVRKSQEDFTASDAETAESVLKDSIMRKVAGDGLQEVRGDGNS